MFRRPVRPHRAYVYQDVGTSSALARVAGNNLVQQPKPNDGMGDMTGTANNNAKELEVDGHLAVAYYERSGNVITFRHTEVPAELGGKGVGSSLVRGALDQVRTEGLKVVAQCPFVNAWIGKHPAYADLLETTG